jgi:large subunit ribosomal protein L15
VRPGFEGGQMPLQKRLPKFGFTSRLAAVTAEIRLSELDKVEGGIVTIDSLRAAGIINNSISRAKVFNSGTVTTAVTLQGVGATKGAAAAIIAAGGKVEENA